MSAPTTAQPEMNTTLEVFEAIRTRRSNGRVGPEMPPRQPAESQTVWLGE